MNLTLKQKKVLLGIFSVLLNTVLFLLSFAFLGSVFATNDDYRMSLIVSGAYTGEPSSTLVFMKYPIAWLLSGLLRHNTECALVWALLHTVYTDSVKRDLLFFTA